MARTFNLTIDNLRSHAAAAGGHRQRANYDTEVIVRGNRTLGTALARMKANLRRHASATRNSNWP